MSAALRARRVRRYGLLGCLLVAFVGILPAAPAAAQDAYWYSGGRRHALVPSDLWTAVEVAPTTRAASLRASLDAAGVDVDWERSLLAQPQHIALLWMPGSRASRSRTQRALSRAPGVVRSWPVFGAGRRAQVVFDELLVQFPSTLSAEREAELERRYGIDLVAPLGRWIPNGYRCRVSAPGPNGALDAANALYENEGVRFSHPNFLSTNVRRQAPAPRAQVLPDDVFFGQQWHLRNTGQGGGRAGADVGAPSAWEQTRGAASIIVGVVDDGIDLSHPDFASPGKLLPGLDLVDGDTDAGHNHRLDGHGTAVAGVIAADGDNGIGVSGIAPGCRIVPVRAIGGALTAEQEARSQTFAAEQGAAIINNSWGPADDGQAYPLPDVMKAALDALTIHGRGGRGVLVFWAAGNGNEDVMLDGYAAYANNITVGASTNRDVLADYSDYGPAIDVVAPSSGGSLRVVTTDWQGIRGYNNGRWSDELDDFDYTNGFGGTSSASPLAAGVAALVLSANPELTREQVQRILQDTAAKIDPAGAHYVDGRCNRYGHGRVDAAAAVRAALQPAGGRVACPVHTTAAVPSGAAGQPTAIAVQVNDTHGDALATGRDTVTVAVAGANHGAAVSVTDHGDGTYTATYTPANPGTDRVEVALNGTAIAGSPFASTVSPPLFEQTFDAGLHLVGLPITPQHPAAAAVFGPGARFARWDAAAARYVEMRGAGEPGFDLAPGVGLWVHLPQPTTVRVPATRHTSRSLDIPLQPGWNIVGNPFDSAMPWRVANLQVVASGRVVGQLSDAQAWAQVEPYAWIYDDSDAAHQLVLDPSFPSAESVANEVPRLGGFWIHAAAPHLALRVSLGSDRAAAPAAPSPGQWATQIEASGDSGRGSVVVGAARRLGRRLAIAAPPEPQPDGLSIHVVAPDGRRSAGELVPVRRESEWALVVAARAAGSVTLSWPSLLRQLPAGAVACLEDLETGRTTRLNTRAAYRYEARADDVRRFRLTVRRGGVERSAITALTVAASRGGRTGVTLTLTGPATVRVTVRGLGGRVVRTLTHEAAAAGPMTLGWDGLDNEGRRVPRGTYSIEAVAVGADGAESRAVRTVTVS